MTQDALVAAITFICNFTNPNINKEKKEICMEYIVNCAIIKDGQISYKIVKECEKKWHKQ